MHVALLVIKTLLLSATRVSKCLTGRILKCYSSLYLPSHLVQKEQTAFFLMTYEEYLRSFGLFNPEKRLREELMEAYSHLKEVEALLSSP